MITSKDTTPSPAMIEKRPAASSSRVTLGLCAALAGLAAPGSAATAAEPEGALPPIPSVGLEATATKRPLSSGAVTVQYDVTENARKVSTGSNISLTSAISEPEVIPPPVANVNPQHFKAVYDRASQTMTFLYDTSVSPGRLPTEVGEVGIFSSDAVTGPYTLLTKLPPRSAEVTVAGVIAPRKFYLFGLIGNDGGLQRDTLRVSRPSPDSRSITITVEKGGDGLARTLEVAGDPAGPWFTVPDHFAPFTGSKSIVIQDPTAPVAFYRTKITGKPE